MHVHSFPYSERPGTLAAEMKGQVEKKIRAERNEKLISAANAVREQLLDLRVGTKQTILTEKNVHGICTGHTEDFIECSFKGDFRAGDYVLVNITSQENGILKGEAI